MRVGFCGTGYLGTPMVQRLLAAGHEVQVWNRTQSKIRALVDAGAVAAPTPRDVAAQCDCVCLCLLDGDAVETVAFGDDGLVHGSRLRWLVDHSSISPERTRGFARRLEHAGAARWIDAPVSGGVPGAQAGTLAVMAGGDAAAVDAVRPLLAAYASRVTHLGASGSGQVAKLCNQIIFATGVLAVAEAIGLAERSGIDARRLPEAFAGGLADSRLMQIFAARMLQPSSVKTGALATLLKDLDAVAAQGADVRSPLPLTAAADAVMRRLQAESRSELDLWEVVRLYRDADCATPASCATDNA